MKPPTFFNEESTQKLDDHELIVHVWCASSDNDSLVGHVSLETSKLYASLWPEKPHLLKDSNSSPINNFTEDLLKEKRPPDYSIKLTTLDVDGKRLINPMLLIYRKCFILLAGTLLNSMGVIFRNLQLFGSAGSLLEYAHSNDTVLGHVFLPFVLN